MVKMVGGWSGLLIERTYDNAKGGILMEDHTLHIYAYDTDSKTGIGWKEKLTARNIRVKWQGQALEIYSGDYGLRIRTINPINIYPVAANCIEIKEEA